MSSPAEAARRKRGGGSYNPPYAAMVVDVKTGRTLHAENEDALRHPASITKVMTLYMLFEQLERGKLGLDSPLTVSANAARQEPSKLGLAPGETIEVEDAIKAIATKSANDVAVTIAENVAGSEDAFAEQMTRKARALGMTRTIYRNASGLPDAEQVTTARDLTILARAIQERFPKYYRYFQTRVFYYAGARISNHNKLLGRVEGVDGIKTGFTRASGFNLMTNAKTEDRHIVAVVLGGRSGASRDQIMASLVRSNLPRAYAGARTAPMVADAPSARPVAVAEAPAPRPAASEAPAARPVMVAEARPAVVVEAGQPIRLQDANVETTAATVPTATPVARKPLDLNSLRPVVASAAGASSTTTPASPPMRWQTGPQALPQAAQAYAPVQQLQPEPARPTVAPARPAAATPAIPAPVQVASAKIEERLPAPPAVKADVSEAKHEAARPAVSGWMIQLGATDDEGKAKTMLSNAKSRSGRVLAKASPFTEKVTRDGSTLYRARFSGFAEADDAQEACKVLKRNGFACFATRS